MSIRRRTRVSALIALACGTALALTGCANPIESLLQKSGEGAIEKLLEKEGVDIDLDGDGGMSFTTEDGTSVDFGGNASVPESWPGLPIPKGDIVASHSGGDQNSIMVTTSQKEVDSLQSALENDGFSVDSTSDLGGISVVQLKKGGMTVSLSTIPDESNGQVALQYMVFGS